MVVSFFYIIFAVEIKQTFIMTNEYLKKFKNGDIIHFKGIFGLDGIGIFDKFTSDGVIYLYCVNYKDLKNSVYFITNKSHQRCIFNIDAITYFKLASDDEIKKLYKLLFERYKCENDDWSEYITDSTYYEIQDWFTYKCGCGFNDDNGFPDFVYEFSQHIWELLLKDIGCEEKEESKMVNLDDACKWLENKLLCAEDHNPTLEFLSIIKYNSLKELINDFRKSMEE